jgi:hypothetical protein
MISVVGANQDPRESETRTLGDVLYVSKAKAHVSEKDWVRLVQSIAAGDQLALHSLYEQMHRIVFTLIVRITNNRETAEELTLDAGATSRDPRRDCRGMVLALFQPI